LGTDDKAVVPASDTSFELRARSATPIDTDVPLRASRRDGDWLRAEYVNRRSAPARGRPALVELSSVLGVVSIQIQPRTAPAELR